jgi:uncharacterized SAM-dependent methyltransferase
MLKSYQIVLLIQKDPMDTIISINDELAGGLLADHASIAPKYFYDAVGSVLFEAICVLPEYYPTRTEASILQHYQREIAQSISADRVCLRDLISRKYCNIGKPLTKEFSN